jgi:chemosensory pili system protein ChpA (sensor histidine kinase/response regulator)
MPFAQNRTRSKILLVDDSNLCRTMTSEVLSRSGFDVVAIRSPLGFSIALYEQEPDLALVDVSMPAFNGDQMVLTAKRSLRNLCPIIFYSERPEEELAALVERCGAAGYIRKSDDWAGIVATIKRFLGQTSSPRWSR